MIRVEIPYLPPAALSPNSRAHWGTKARATAQCRRDAYLCAVVDGGVPLKRARLKVIIYIKDKRAIRDADNTIASCKAFIDGCVDAVIIPDDTPAHLTIDGIEYIVSKEKAPMTVLEFKEV